MSAVVTGTEFQGRVPGAARARTGGIKPQLPSSHSRITVAAGPEQQSRQPRTTTTPC